MNQCKIVAVEVENRAVRRWLEKSLNVLEDGVFTPATFYLRFRSKSRRKVHI